MWTPSVPSVYGILYYVWAQILCHEQRKRVYLARDVLWSPRTCWSPIPKHHSTYELGSGSTQQ